LLTCFAKSLNTGLIKSIFEGEKMAEEKLKFNMKAELFSVYEVDNRVIAIYKVTPTLEEEDTEFANFYLVTYDNGISETPFGVGPTPWAALEYAAAAWDLPQDGKPNPFRQVLSSSSQSS